MARSRKRRGSVEWDIPGRKTPIAYSTLATSHLIALLAEQGGTIREVRDRIVHQGIGAYRPGGAGADDNLFKVRVSSRRSH